MIPETAGSGTTAGEREVFQVFKKYLPNDWVVYHNPVVLGKEMDFVVLAKGFGVLVLEVKDYKARNIVSLSPDKWELSSIDKQTTAPLKQAMQYARKIETCLQKDADLVHFDGKSKGRLKFPYGYGVILSRISESDVAKLHIDEIIPDNQLLTQTDIQDEEWLEKYLVDKIISMLSYQFGRGALGDDEIKRIRYHLFPELRIGKSEEGIYVEEGIYRFRTLEAMDLHQERVAKSLGSGHRLIRGVAGSGKTLILAARTKYLAVKNPEWKILVLTNNNTLTSAIDETIQMLVTRDDETINASNITVSTFTAWLYSNFKSYPYKEDVGTLADFVANGTVNCQKYDAILIDEGQDFLPEWFRLAVSCLNPETGSLLIVEDRAQNLLKRKVSFLKQTGLDFRGRSNVLSVNYRNTQQVAEFAWKFYQEMSKDLETGEDETTSTTVIIPPKVSNRKGTKPLVKRFVDFSEECLFVAGAVLRLIQDRGCRLSDFGILYRAKQLGAKDYVQTLVNVLNTNKIQVNWVTSDKDSKKKFSRSEESVKLLSIDSSKGLDFKVVFIVNADNVPLPFLKGEDLQSEIARMYVAMTRATEHLLITYSGDSLITKWLDQYNVSKQQSQQVKMEKF